MSCQQEELPKGEPLLAEARRRFSAWDAIAYCAGIALFPAMFFFASRLHPAKGGIGTHTQLHLPPCGIFMLFGKPCPSCGMTTAFSLLAKGRIGSALSCQPAGVAVFAAFLALWAYLPLAILKKRPVEHIFELKPFLPVTLFLILAILATWLFKLAG